MKKIQVLGTGCAKCKELYSRAEAAVARTGIEAELSKVEDINQIVELGVMLTPGLIIDGEVVSSGKLLSGEELERLFTQ
jgi:small redox-active disulfide protein 2